MSRGAAADVRRSLAGTPLRLRLVGVVLALVTLALAVTGAAATTALRGYLLDRVDRQLAATTRVMATRVEHGVPGFGERRARVDLPSAFFVQVTAEDGVPRSQLSAPLPNASRPVLPLLDSAAVRARAGAAFTVPGSDGGADWRVLAVPLAADVGSVAVAVSLADVQSTVARLVVIDVVVGLGALGLLAVLGYAVVRSNLRPLVAVETTAAAIAAGDLTRRVPESDPRTELGRLARTLNTMLGQIESAFRARSTSEAAARASEDRMRRFVADASHELRTPLTSIRGFAELYRQGAAEARDDVAGLMRRIEDEAARMGVLVEDLLLLARLDQQRPLDRRPVDLLVVAADAVHDARVLAPAHSVDLRLDPSAEPPVVLDDEGRLRQVVANLLTNATTHTPAGTHVTVTVGSDGGRCAVLDVVDDGPGMSDEDAARAFERFYRADRSRTRRQGGSGLGLTIVAALVSAHDGSVDLHTAPASGTTVRVRLPLQDGQPRRPGITHLVLRLLPARRRTLTARRCPTGAPRAETRRATMVDERYSASSAGWRARKWTVAAVAAGGLAVGAVGVAAAASDAPTPGPQGESTLSDPPAGWRGHGRFAGRGHGLLGGPAVRGEFVVPKSGGGYQTVAMQRETVATVSSSSIRVKSADGVSRTFRVTADTLVNAARDGIGSVKVNDSVAVVAVKSGDTATAVRIVDASRADTSRERFGFRER